MTAMAKRHAPCIVLCVLIVLSSASAGLTVLNETHAAYVETYDVSFQPNGIAIFSGMIFLNVLIPPDASVTSFTLMGASGDIYNTSVTYSGCFTLRCYRFAQAAFWFTSGGDSSYSTINVKVTVQRNSVAYVPCSGDELADPIIQRLKTCPYSGNTFPINAFGNLNNAAAWRGYPILSVEKNSSYQLQAQAVDYLVVGSKDAFAALYPLLQLKSQQGLRTYFESTQDIGLNYNGNSSQMKNREFLKDAFNQWHMKYVLLVGNNKTLPPIPYTARNWQVGETVYDDNETCDYYYSLLEQPAVNFSFNWPTKTVYDFPDFVLGRFPFDDKTQVASLVAKTVAYEQDNSPGDWVRTNAIAAGDTLFRSEGMPWNMFTLDSRPKIVLGNPGNLSIQSLTDLINQGVGCLYTNTHGDPTLYWINSTQIFTYNEVSRLNNTRLPVIFSGGCHTGKFDVGVNGSQSIGVQLLAKANSGAVAIVSGTSFTPYADLVYYSTYNYYNSNVSANYLVPTWMIPNANYSVGKAFYNFNALNTIEYMILLGDPALQMATAKYDLPPTLTPTPAPPPTPLPTPDPTPTPTASPSPTTPPVIPELPFWAAIPAFASEIILAALIVRRKTAKP